LTRGGPYAVQTVAVVVLLFIVLQLWRFDFHVPFNNLGDSLWYAALAKSITQNGWTYYVPQLSAPFGLPAASFPSMTNVDWLVMKALSAFLRDPATVFNVFWLLSILVTAWTALFSLRILGVPPWVSCAGGLIYSCLPFTWLRSTSHLSLVFFAVPLLCAYATYLVRGPVAPWTDQTYRRTGIIGALLQGFDYLYYAWFGILLFAAAGIVGYASRRHREALTWAGLGIAVLCIATVINLSPSFVAWQRHGKPDIGYKVPSEAEIYGLKIRQLLLPSGHNPLPPLRTWATLDARASFPLENENRTARLGLVGALGFLYLLWSIVVPAKDGPHGATIKAIAALNLFALSVTTVGGFGAIINTLTVPEIRAYNRFSVFIAFFATAGVSLWLADGWRRTPRPRRLILAAVAAALAAFSLYDQVLDARGITRGYDRDRAAAAEAGAVVGRMEAVLPDRTAVFQFPITDFPRDARRGPMFAYDHALPYLQSDHLRWSWPSLSPKHVAWSRYVRSIRGAGIVRVLAGSGFGAVWVDRYGYRDRGAAIVNTLVSDGAVEIAPGTSRRYAVFDIRASSEH
jgi:hypothetical protein